MRASPDATRHSSSRKVPRRERCSTIATWKVARTDSAWAQARLWTAGFREGAVVSDRAASWPTASARQRALAPARKSASPKPPIRGPSPRKSAGARRMTTFAARQSAMRRGLPGGGFTSRRGIRVLGYDALQVGRRDSERLRHRLERLQLLRLQRAVGRGHPHRRLEQPLLARLVELRSERAELLGERPRVDARLRDEGLH